MNPKVDFDEYTGNYNDLLREGTKFFSANEEYFARYKIDLIRADLKGPVSRILEYGCGIGRNIAYLQAAFPGAEVIGTDISIGSLEFARRENPGVRFEVEGVNARLDLGKFDLIFVAGVFHHIPVVERPGVARVLADRLGEAGTLYVFEHNPYNPVTRRIVNACPYDADAVLVKPAELRSLVTAAELEWHRHAYCLFVPPKLSLLKPVERLLEWLPLGGQYWMKARHPT
jgi:SAM-dependent methyltransferase